MPRPFRACLVFVAFGLAASAVFAADPTLKDPRAIDAALPDLSEFKTVDTAISTRISGYLGVASQPGYLGVHVDSTTLGQLLVTGVEPESPAAKAGVQVGDFVRAVAGQQVTNNQTLRDLLQGKNPGDAVSLTMLRKDQPLELSATLAATSRPLSLTTQRAVLGLRVDEAEKGVKIAAVTPGLPAAEAGLKSGDVIVKIDGVAITGPDKFSSSLSDKKPGQAVTLVYRRDGKEVELKTKMAVDPTSDARPTGWDNRGLTIWKKEVYRLAVVQVEYPDVKHNPSITSADWQQALFSRGVYNHKNATGQQVFGSMNDFYVEQSCGKLRVEGRVFDYVTANKKRADYANDSNRFALLTETLDKLHARDGKDALKDFDGVFFIYAGSRYVTNRGGIYWPHRSFMNYKGKRLSYFICPEGGSRMDSISILTHEFGHMLGLPDLYARPESPGSEGLGIWCLMSVGHGRDGKPLHMSAWCKEQLGWLKPTLIDPTMKQKLVLAPIENSAKECVKVLIRPDGSEYLLLENRVARNYDRDLPAEGLLIWRVVDGRPVLEESHGIEGPQGPERFLGSIPYPSKSNNAFTPYTTPSSRSQKGGGLPVHITNIRKLPDGRVTFHVGYEYL